MLVRSEIDCLAAALQYASRGWRVFPCKGKIPLTPDGQVDFAEAVSAARDIAGDAEGYWDLATE